MDERLSWFVENRVVWVTPRKVTTIESLTEDNERITKMIRAAFAATDLPVHVIIDGSVMGTQPSPLEGRKLLTYINEPGMGYRIVAGIGNPSHHFFSTFVGKQRPGTSLVMSTIEQALSTLTLKDDTLPDMLSLYRAARKGDE